MKEKEAYAIVMALRKWASWIGLQPLLILSDHKSLEEWAHEVLDSPTGPTGRQARWHMLLSHFHVTVGYVPGRDNGIADIMSRWAYPAADAVSDVSIHGTPEDDEKMEAIIKTEEAEEKECRMVHIVWPQGMLEEYKRSGKEVEILTDTRKPRVLDLFAGTGSFSRPFADLGWEVYTLDHNPRFHPTMCCDILEWNPQEFPPGFFDVVLASPPCQDFSIANHHKPPGLHRGDCYVLQTLRVIEYLQPQVWLLENPRTGALPHRSYMAKIPFSDFDYCEFAQWGYKKPTRIWGSPQISRVKPVLCQGTCKNMAQPVEGQRPRHKQWLGAYGHQPSQTEKYRIPEKLVKYLIDNLGELTLSDFTQGASSFPVDPGHATLQVLTRAGRGIANGEEGSGASEPELLDGAPPPVHPPRSTKKRRMADGIPPHDAPPVQIKIEEDEEVFVTPPGSPTFPPRTLPSEAPPPPPPPAMRFQFKAHRAPEAQAAPQEPSSSSAAPAPPPPRPVRPPRVDQEAMATPNTAASRLPPLTDDPGKIFDLEWDAWYELCPKWEPAWSQIHDENGDWPIGFQLLDGKLFLDGKLCVSLGLTRDVVRAHHFAVGHIGRERLLIQMSRFYQWASEERVKRYAKLMQETCHLCQAMEHPHHALNLRQDPVVIPPVLMDSVAIDIFSMPPATFEGTNFDCFVACVDRLSGWIVAFPATRRGLTANFVAKQMFHRAWSLFGVPTKITSDQGPQFAAAWWQTLCGCLGIRQAFAQAYHHQANGRAEAAGRELQRKLRFLHESCPTMSWVEALPVAVQQIHDAPGESGLSPYEIVMGRTRNLAGVPIPT